MPLNSLLKSIYFLEDENFKLNTMPLKSQIVRAEFLCDWLELKAGEGIDI